MRGLRILVTKYLGSNRSFDQNFIVICSSCKRVNNKEGYWKDLDGSWKIADRVLSHGLCPQCAENYRSEIMELVRAAT